MSQPEKTLTFVEHLEELRYRLIVSIAALFLATFLAMPLADNAIALLTHPLLAATTSSSAPKITLRLVPDPASPGSFRLEGNVTNLKPETKDLAKVQVDLVLTDGRVRSIGEGSRTGTSFYYRSLTDPIMMLFKTALILGLILAIPVWVYQLWAFVAPGLKENERRLVMPLFMLSAILFPCGVVFAYFALKLVIGFLLSIEIHNLAPLLDYSSYVRFAVKLLLGFGVVFELPVVVLLLAHLGIVNASMLRQYRRIAYVVIAVVAMVVTPPDPISMIVMMVPLYALYELSVFLTAMVERTTRKQEA